ncbi:MAG: hypothetical protein PUF82_02810 [Lactobacillus equicursoris]|uniref:hypothetical protein n=1 Tax=Lactobacillus equicursoris TaxID=420645 RepID=UPI00242BFAB3|nr:hypothetical protein [Lactobacillus equicursoris]MDD6406928.1 hypothetical protein [Lactobacillus equicursoris]
MSKQEQENEKRSSKSQDRDLLTAHMNAQLKEVRNHVAKPEKTKLTGYRLFGMIISAVIIISALLAIFRLM